MQIKVIKGVSLKVFYDSIFNISWVSFLAEDSFLKIKLPCDFKQYKYSYLLNPHTRLTCRLVKTKKNWVLTEIKDFYNFYQPKEFKDYVKLSEFAELILSRVKENQNLDTYFFWLDFLENRGLSGVDRNKFEFELDKNLGFN